jgi:drug/metabolite transporter (DMT)-like permease
MTPPGTGTDPRRRALFLLAVLALVWGTNWPLFPYAVREVSVWTFRAVSMLLAGALLLAVARSRGQRLAIARTHWPVLCLAAWSYLLVWNVASTYAAVLIPSGQAALLGFTMPLWAALITWALWREPITARMAAALALGAAGVGLLIWRSAEAYAHAPLGLACGLLAAVGWAVGTLVLKRSRLGAAGVPATVLTGWQLLIAAVPVAVVALLRAQAAGQGWFVPGVFSLAVIAYILVVPMALGNVVWFSIVGLLPAQVAGLGSIAVPMVAMVAGALVHGEPLGPVQWAAMACCAGGLWLALPRAAPARGAGSG